MTNLQYITKRFVKYMRRTYKNKLVFIGLLILGFITARLTDDASLIAIAVMFFSPLFFINTDCFHY